MKKLRPIHNFNIRRYSFVLCYFIYFSFYMNAHMRTLFCVYVHAHLLTVIQRQSTGVCSMPGTMWVHSEQLWKPLSPWSFRTRGRR